MYRFISAAFVIVLMCSPTWAAETSTAADQESVAVTVYNNGLGLVREVRTLKLPRGVNELRFMDVAQQIDATSVHIKSITAPNKLSVLEQNYEYDLLEPNKLLDKYVGKQVKLLFTNPYTDKEEIKADLDRVYGLFPILGERRRQLAGTLSGGEQQMLAISRSIMSAPRILMLDEPSLGLAPLIVKDIFRVVEEISRDGTTVLIVEQNAMQALRLADRGYVLENGRVLMSGPSEEFFADELIRTAYLGL